MNDFLSEKNPAALAFVILEAFFAGHVVLNVLSLAAHYFFVEPAFGFDNGGKFVEVFILTGIPYYDPAVAFASMITAMFGLYVLGAAAIIAGCAIIVGIWELVKLANKEVFGHDS